MEPNKYQPPTALQIQQAQEQLARANMSFFSVFPLYYHLFAGLAKIHADRIDTVGVGFLHGNIPVLLYNVEFVNKLTVNELSIVLQHEAQHIGLQHLQRMKLLKNIEPPNIREGYTLTPKSRRHIINLAMDVIVNGNIVNLNELPEWLLNGLSVASKYPFLKDKDVRTMTCEDIVFLMLQNIQFDYINCCSLDSHDGWEAGELTAEQQGALDELMRDAAKKMEGKSPGNIPGDMQRYIDELMKVTFDWRKQLSIFAQSVAMDEKSPTWKKQNRRFGFAAPGTKRSYRPNLLVVLDNSGSTADIYNLFMAHILRLSSYMDIDAIGVDADVNFEFTFKGGKMPPKFKDAHSGGGTMAQPAFEYAKQKKKYDGLIYLTDGYFFDEHLKTYDIPTIFAIGPGGKHVTGYKNIDIPSE